jgi:hypothetical protein
MANIKSANASKDSIIAVLSEHEHVIDCIKWATPEACITIENADYNKSKEEVT